MLKATRAEVAGSGGGPYGARDHTWYRQDLCFSPLNYLPDSCLFVVVLTLDLTTLISEMEIILQKNLLIARFIIQWVGCLRFKTLSTTYGPQVQEV